MSTIRHSRAGTIIAPRPAPQRTDGAQPVDHRRLGTTAAGSRWGFAPAALRIGLGFVFLWAFLDKTFGLGYATSSAHAWIHGGSPTQGFLAGVSAGPLQSTFHSWAGEPWIDWAFMLGLLSVGVALILGVGLRLAAVAGTLMMALMWAAEWPLASHASNGTATASSNPIVDYHLIYALVLIALAISSAGRRYGLGSIRTGRRLIERLPWLA